MKIVISVVSHRHHDVIINLGTLKSLAKFDHVEVICRDNKPLKKLQLYCEKFNIHYVANQQQQGFAVNNNANYCYAKEQLGLVKDDYFVLLNPDVFLKQEGITSFLKALEKPNVELGVANLFLDREEMVHDDNIRLYPKLGNFITTYLFDDRSTMINRKKPLNRDLKYWASCAFMSVNAGLYEQLLGLDERYYMYCEDIDFCFRAKTYGCRLTYLDNVRAVHFRQRDSKRFLTKYFFWHVLSVLKYSLSKKSVTPKKSMLSRLYD